MKKYIGVIGLVLLLTSCGEVVSDGSNVNGNNGLDLGLELDSNVKMSVENSTFYTMSGEEVELFDYLDKPIVLNVWASWCGPCKVEMESFQEQYDVYGDEVNFLMMNMEDGRRETKETATSYIEEMDFDMPFYFDTKQKIALSFGVTQIPMTYFINTDATEMSKHIGLITTDELSNQIENLIENNNNKNK